MKVTIAINLTRNPEKYQALVDQIQLQCGKNSKNLELIFCPDPETLQARVAECEIVACYDFFKPVFEQAKKIKWLHLGSAGIDHTIYPELRQSDITITNSRGIHAVPMSEFVMAALLNYTKRLDRCRELRTTREWQKWEIAKTLITLSGKTLGILGYGGVGKAVAQKAKTFGMKVFVYKLRTVTESDPQVDGFFYGRELPELLKHSDFVVVLLPLTTKTQKMIGKEEFKWLKPEAYLVNVSRGKIFDEAELIEHLRLKKIAGAFLDVFEQEPLPPESPFYNLDQVFISPHIAGNFPEYVAKVGEIFTGNLNRYLTGKPLQNVYNRELEY